MEALFTKFGLPLLDKPVVQFANQAISFKSVFYAAIILLIAYGIFFSVRFTLAIQVKRKKIRSAQGKALLQLFGYILTILAIFYSASTLGYSLTYLLLGSTALLVGLGFGLQQLFLDLVSGVILLIDKNVNLGDVVKVDIPSGKEQMFGKIFHIGLRATLLQTIDNEFLIVPNSKFLSSGVRSLMRDKGAARFRIHIMVEFGQDMNKARRTLTEAVLKDPRVDQEPGPTIIIREFKEYGAMLEIRFWMKELFNSEIILSDMRFKILEDFTKNGIKIPYPHHVLHNFTRPDIH